VFHNILLYVISLSSEFGLIPSSKNKKNLNLKSIKKNMIKFFRNFGIESPEQDYKLI